MSTIGRFWVAFVALLAFGLYNSFVYVNYSGSIFLVAAFLLLAYGPRRN